MASALLLVAAIVPVRAASSEEGFVYTANEDGTLSAIDLSTGQVKSIATRISAHNVQVSRDGCLLLAVAGHSPSRPQIQPG